MACLSIHQLYKSYYKVFPMFPEFKAWIQSLTYMSDNDRIPENPLMSNPTNYPYMFENVLSMSFGKKYRSYNYSTNVIEYKNDQFKLFGLECKEVIGFDEGMDSVKSKISFKNVRLYIIDFGYDYEPQVYVFEPYNRPKYDCIEVRFVDDNIQISKYFKFAKRPAKKCKLPPIKRPGTS